MRSYILRVVPGGQPAANVNYDDDGMDMDAPADVAMLCEELVYDGDAVTGSEEVEVGRETYKSGREACEALLRRVQR